MPTPVPLYDVEIVPITSFWSPWVSTTGLGWQGGTDASVSLNTRFTGDTGGTYLVQVMNGDELTTYTMTNSGSLDIPLGGDTGQSYVGQVSVRVMNLTPHLIHKVEISAPGDGGYQLILPNADDQFTLRNIAQSLGSNPEEDATPEEYQAAITSSLDANGDGLPSLLEIFQAFHDAGETFMSNIIANAMQNSQNGCFAAGTTISMADGSKKRIEEIVPDDWVISYDKNGKLIPGKVTATKSHEVEQLLDVFGLQVTPGHVTFCGDGKFSGRHVPIIDILRTDGALVRKDGTKVRAVSGCEVGSIDDREFWAVLIHTDETGTERVRDKKKIRLGTRFMLPDGRHFSMRDFMEANDIELLENGYVRFGENGVETPFIWPFSDRLPNPEDFVLARSRTTLADIYRADEWEDRRPSLPAPI